MLNQTEIIEHITPDKSHYFTGFPDEAWKGVEKSDHMFSLGGAFVLSLDSLKGKDDLIPSYLAKDIKSAPKMRSNLNTPFDEFVSKKVTDRASYIEVTVAPALMKSPGTDMLLTKLNNNKQETVAVVDAYRLKMVKSIYPQSKWLAKGLEDPIIVQESDKDVALFMPVDISQRGREMADKQLNLEMEIADRIASRLVGTSK